MNIIKRLFKNTFAHLTYSWHFVWWINLWKDWHTIIIMEYNWVLCLSKLKQWARLMLSAVFWSCITKPSLKILSQYFSLAHSVIGVTFVVHMSTFLITASFGLVWVITPETFPKKYRYEEEPKSNQSSRSKIHIPTVLM